MMKTVGVRSKSPVRQRMGVRAKSKLQQRKLETFNFFDAMCVL